MWVQGIGRGVEAARSRSSTGGIRRGALRSASSMVPMMCSTRGSMGRSVLVSRRFRASARQIDPRASSRTAAHAVRSLNDTGSAWPESRPGANHRISAARAPRTRPPRSQRWCPTSPDTRGRSSAPPTPSENRDAARRMKYSGIASCEGRYGSAPEYHREFPAEQHDRPTEVYPHQKTGISSERAIVGLVAGDTVLKTDVSPLRYGP